MVGLSEQTSSKYAGQFRLGRWFQDDGRLLVLFAYDCVKKVILAHISLRSSLVCIDVCEESRGKFIFQMEEVQTCLICHSQIVGSYVVLRTFSAE